MLSFNYFFLILLLILDITFLCSLCLLCCSIETRMGEALRAQQTALEGSVLAAVRSGALTPAPDSREAAEVQIFNLLQAGHYNTAFQQV